MSLAPTAKDSIHNKCDKPLANYCNSKLYIKTVTLTYQYRNNRIKTMSTD
jgi:hypothetical protein